LNTSFTLNSMTQEFSKAPSRTQFSEFRNSNKSFST